MRTDLYQTQWLNDERLNSPQSRELTVSWLDSSESQLCLLDLHPGESEAKKGDGAVRLGDFILIWQSLILPRFN